jgi:hypothetical protein
MVDPTAIEIDFDPTVQRMKGVTVHGGMPFDVPIISEIGPILWQGGCQDGLILPCLSGISCRYTCGSTTGCSTSSTAGDAGGGLSWSLRGPVGRAG